MGWYTEVEEMMKKDSSLGNCGVAGCYSKDSAGNVYLNGQLIRTKAEDEKYQLQLKKIQEEQNLMLQQPQTSSVSTENVVIDQSEPNSIKNLLSKPFNLLIIGGAVVLGFLAYKKFKK